MSPDLTGQRIVVTGITGGIAHATAKRLLSLGAEVLVTARSREKLDRALIDLDGKISGEVMDLLDPRSIAGFFQMVGPFDHLVTPAASGTLSPLRDLNLEKARELLETKQWGQLLCAREGVKSLRETGSITLFSGTVTQKPLAGGSAFAAVGAASEAMGRIWGLELAPIRVNTVVPGVIDTRVWPDILGGQAASATLDTIAEALPVKRVGTADEVAKAVVFLIDNGFVNGISLVVDGGHRLI